MHIAGSYHHKVAELVSYAMGIRQRKVRKQELKVESASRRSLKKGQGCCHVTEDSETGWKYTQGTGNRVCTYSVYNVAKSRGVSYETN